MVRAPTDKRAAVEELLSASPTMVHLDPRVPGVDVPPDLATGPVLRLKFSWYFAHPLTLDDEGIHQRLSFGSGAWSCVVPWRAVFAAGPAQDTPSFVWPADLPPEMKELLAEAARADDEALVVPEDPPDPPDPPEPPDDEPDPPGTVRRGHLRLVKG